MISCILLAVLSLPISDDRPRETEPTAIEALLRKGMVALRAGKHEEARTLANEAVTLAPREPRAYHFRGLVDAALRQPTEAIADFSRCLELDPQFADAWQRRGEEQFKTGAIEKSLADFDRFLALRPDARPGHWQRGIALYYAHRFKEGAEQFKAGERVFGNDVENAVWHYLCNAKRGGPTQARQEFLKIGHDQRVPLMVVYDLFAGRVQPEAVLKATEEGQPTPAEQAKRRFYAHLYLGLYYDAAGDTAKALEHLNHAAEDHGIGGYMGDVARVHRRLLAPKPTAPHER